VALHAKSPKSPLHVQALLWCSMLAAILAFILITPQVQSLKLGYVSFTTVRAPVIAGAGEQFAPEVLVLFTETTTHATSIALMDHTGTAVVPLRAGSYCAAAYGSDGKIITLAEYSQRPTHRCFQVRVGTTIEASLAIAPMASYTTEIPALGVE
jgi:hypothetical protein